MNGTMRFVLSLGVAVGISTGLSAQPIVPATGTTVSQHELKKEIAQAHTPEQYSVIANHFRQKEKVFRDEAAEEKAEWERRKQSTISLGVKYPTPTDSARNLYNYYDYKADQMSRRAAEYEGRAKTEAAVAAK
jgi:DNA repair photolyase